MGVGGDHASTVHVPPEESESLVSIAIVKGHLSSFGSPARRVCLVQKEGSVVSRFKTSVTSSGRNPAKAFTASAASEYMPSARI